MRDLLRLIKGVRSQTPVVLPISVLLRNVDQTYENETYFYHEDKDGWIYFTVGSRRTKQGSQCLVIEIENLSIGHPLGTFGLSLNEMPFLPNWTLKKYYWKSHLKFNAEFQTAFHDYLRDIRIPVEV